MVITIQIWFGWTRFRKYFCVCTVTEKSTRGMGVSLLPKLLEHHGEKSRGREGGSQGGLQFRPLMTKHIILSGCRRKFLSPTVWKKLHGEHSGGQLRAHLKFFNTVVLWWSERFHWGAPLPHDAESRCTCYRWRFTSLATGNRGAKVNKPCKQHKAVRK